MRSNFLKMGLVLGVASCAALFAPACGSSDDSGGGKAGTGGTAGTDAGTGGAAGMAGSSGTGGTAGASGTGGSSGTSGTGGSAGATGMTCGTSTCIDYNIASIVDLPACCAGTGSDKCGSDLTAAHNLLPAIPAVCEEQNQPGTPDTSCPGMTLPVINLPVDGCCRPDGLCGMALDLSSLGGPNFGCADSSPFIDGGTPAACGGNTDGGAGAAGASGSAGASGASGSAGAAGATDAGTD